MSNLKIADSNATPKIQPIELNEPRTLVDFQCDVNDAKDISSTKSTKAGFKRLRTETLTQHNIIEASSQTLLSTVHVDNLNTTTQTDIAISILLLSKIEVILSHVQDERVPSLQRAISELKYQILFIQQEMSQNTAVINKLRVESSQSQDTVRSLNNALVRQSELINQFQIRMVDQGRLIAQIQSALEKNVELSQKLQEAISDNKKLIDAIKRDISAIQGLQDILVTYGNNSEGLPPLHAAIRSGDLEAIKILVKHGADVNSKAIIIDEFGKNPTKAPVKCTALHLAVLLNQTEIIRFLIENGADAVGYDKIAIDPLKLNDLLMEAATKKENPIVLSLQRFDLQTAEYLLQKRKDDLAKGKPTFDFPGYQFTRECIPGHTHGSTSGPYKPFPIAFVNSWGVVEFRYENRIDFDLLNLLMKYDEQYRYMQHFQQWYENAYCRCDLEAIICMEKIRRSKNPGLPINTPRPSYLIDIFSGSVPFDQKNKLHFFDGNNRFPPGNIFEFRNDDNEKVRELKRQYKILIST